MRQKVTGHPKKVHRELDQLERCGFLHSVYHVTINTFEAFLDIAKFWPFLLYFMGIFRAKKLQVFENGSKLILSDRLGI